MSLEDNIRDFAVKECGIAVLGFTTAEPFEKGIERLDELRDYYETTGRGHRSFANRDLRLRLFPREFCPEARSIIVAAEPIPPGNVADKSEPGRPRGICATNYARRERSWYHVLDARMDRLAEFIRSRGHKAVPVYDLKQGRQIFRIQGWQGLLLRPAAVRAGFAQWGKNAMVCTKEFGSWVVLSALYTDAEIPPDPPADPESDCGDCTACQKACPHNALSRAYVVDVQNCMTLTGRAVQNPDCPVSEARRRTFGLRVSGCDICQSVCPKNRNLSERQQALYDELDPDKLHPALLPLNESLSQPFWWRNIIALGNSGDPVAVGPLLRLLGDCNRDALLTTRIYAAWALGRINDPHSVAGLEKELQREHDPIVRREIVEALRNLGRVAHVPLGHPNS